MDATTAAEEERLLKNILTQAKVDSDESVKKLLSQSHIRASDLLAEPEQRAEVMLQKAGLLVGDVYKIVRVLQTFQNDPASSPPLTHRAVPSSPLTQTITNLKSGRLRISPILQQAVMSQQAIREPR